MVDRTFSRIVGGRHWCHSGFKVGRGGITSGRFSAKDLNFYHIGVAWLRHHGESLTNSGQGGRILPGQGTSAGVHGGALVPGLEETEASTSWAGCDILRAPGPEKTDVRDGRRNGDVS